MEEITANPTFVPIFQIAGGLLLLLLGRKLFWVFVGVIGFLAGMQFGADLVSGQPEWVLLVAAVVVGLVAALLAVFLQRIAVAIAGGIVGGTLAMEFAVALGASAEPWPLVAFVVGAIIAAILVSVVFDWALILLSSLFGAFVIAQGLGLSGTLEGVVILILTVVGIIAQAALLRRGRGAAAA